MKPIRVYLQPIYTANLQLIAPSGSRFSLVQSAGPISVEVQRFLRGPAGRGNAGAMRIDYAPNIVIDLQDIGLNRAVDILVEGPLTIGFAGFVEPDDALPILVRLEQGMGGPYAVDWDTDTVKFGADVPSFPLTAAVGEVDHCVLVARYAALAVDAVAYSRKYPAV